MSGDQRPICQKWKNGTNYTRRWYIFSCQSDKRNDEANRTL